MSNLLETTFYLRLVRDLRIYIVIAVMSTLHMMMTLLSATPLMNAIRRLTLGHQSLTSISTIVNTHLKDSALSIDSLMSRKYVPQSKP